MTPSIGNNEILALFTATGKDIPHKDSDSGRAAAILQKICDSQGHTVPEYKTNFENQKETLEIFEALREIENHMGEDDFTLTFGGNEYRIIAEDAIWEIYRDEIQQIVEDCYSDVILKLEEIPDFIAFSIDWEQTAQNAYADGYGHTFSRYDGSEEEAAGYYIFRTE
jgi:hypothetical protein